MINMMHVSHIIIFKCSNHKALFLIGINMKHVASLYCAICTITVHNLFTLFVIVLDYEAFNVIFLGVTIDEDKWEYIFVDVLLANRIKSISIHVIVFTKRRNLLSSPFDFLKQI